MNISSLDLNPGLVLPTTNTPILTLFSANSFLVETEALTVLNTLSGTSCMVPWVKILKHFWNQTPFG